MKRFIGKDHIGISLVIVGLAIWLIPFILVAIDNAVGATKPADLVISNLGLIVITISPILILLGLILLALRSFRRTKP